MTVSWLPDSFASTDVDDAGIDPLADSFVSSRDEAALNARGYVDIEIQAPGALELDINSVTDIFAADHVAEFTMSSTNGGIDFDFTRAPALVSEVGDVYTFRYWTVGDAAAAGTITITQVANSSSFTDGTLNADAGIVTPDLAELNTSWIDVTFFADGSGDIDPTTIDNTDFALNGLGAAGLGFAATPPLQIRDNTFTYFLTGDFEMRP